MPINPIDIQFFKKTHKIHLSAAHPVVKGRLRFSDKTWFCKTVESELHARRELLSQEFYRLILKNQPETRIAKTSDGKTYYILSEEIPGFKPLPLNEHDNFMTGVYIGLGSVLIVAVFVHEIDLNLDNIGLNDQNQVLKIDGGWSMASTFLPEDSVDKPFDLTVSCIQTLPFLSDYAVYNWLDIIYSGEQLEDYSHIVSSQLSQSPHFRVEINQTMLSILVLPESYIQAFAKLYLLENIQYFVDVFRLRQTELRRCALDDPSFFHYLQTPEAQAWVLSYVDHLKTFTTHQFSSVIPESAHDGLRQAVQNQFAELSNQATVLATVPPTEIIQNDDKDDSKSLENDWTQEWDCSSITVSEDLSSPELPQSKPSSRWSGCLSSLLGLFSSKTSPVVEPSVTVCHRI